MKKIMCAAVVLALCTVVLGCKKEETPEQKATGLINKASESAKQAVSDANKAVQDATKK